MFFIVGPTAVGKTELALEVAERIGAEILGADAFQVYEGLDILSAKPSATIRSRVPHHLIGEIPLSRSFDVAQYLELAQNRIREITARGKRVLIVGGTGLYVRALTRGLADLPGANPELRAELETWSLERLQQRLQELDPACAAAIDTKNPRRLIRAIEICLLTGRPFSSFRQEWQNTPAKSAGIFLTRDRDDLYARINARTEEMFHQDLLDEIRNLGEIGPTASQVIGLTDLQALLRGEITEAECISRIQQATRRYAKRQLTWFKREPMLEPFNLTNFSQSQSVSEVITQKLLSAVQDD